MVNNQKDKSLSAYSIRKIILEQSKRANVGHIGSALSVADIIVAVYQHILQISSLKVSQRDRFILSKGHAALALYAAFYLKGWISEKQLNTFCGNDSFLGVHPEHSLKGVDFATGSLGQGLSVGVGSALAAKLRKTDYRSFVLISDAELNEGSTWEAVMFAAQQRLGNLIAILDMNRQQAIGYTKEILDLNPLKKKFESFGWEAVEVDGHDIPKIVKAIKSFKTKDSAPHILLAKTTFGSGVSYMESKIKWHYWPMSDQEFETALHDIKRFR